ncbi:hypothetical protein EV363DRAFT_1461469 [Boletus edulis]|nr:hypothetical protein EV363DRAFT_1461469 [Boletus edulis]
MSSDIQSALELLVLNNHLSVLIVSAVVYDYILTFSREVSHSFSTSISYRWLTFFKDRVHLGKERPLSSRYNVPNAFTVQTVDLGFHNVIAVRYIGLCWIVTNALDGSSFVPVL